ncbi:MAG: hypothetical protein WB460_08320, partial [Candidatus Acidiferrales bacterium]
AKTAIPARCRFDDPKIIAVIVHAFGRNAKSTRGRKIRKKRVGRDSETGCVSGIRSKDNPLRLRAKRWKTDML